MTKAIIFDLGNVYFDIDWKAIDLEMREKFGISSLIRSNYGKEINRVYDKAQRGKVGLKDVFALICKNKNLNPEEITNYYKKCYKENKRIDERFVSLINQLKTKVKVACFSNTNDIHFLAHEEQKQLNNFDFVFASFKIGRTKEDEGAFENVLNELGTNPEEAILIDDDIKNIENAKAHGLKAIKYENYNQLINELKKLKL